MALLFIDSFDHYDTAHRLAKWTTDSSTNPVTQPSSTIIAGAGRCGSNAMFFGGGAGTLYVAKGLTFSGLTGICGYAVQFLSQLQNTLNFFAFTSLAGSLTNVYFTRQIDGSISAWVTGSPPTLLGSTPADSVKTGIFYFLEFKVLIDLAAGSVEIRVNGVSKFAVAGVRTVATSAGAIADLTGIVFSNMPNNGYYIDDLYVCDTSGPAPNNTYLGDVRVEYLAPRAAGAHQDWALVGAASHWQAVWDGSAPDDDTSYLSSSTVSQIDTELYAQTGLPSGTIFGVQINIFGRKTDSGFREVAPVIRLGGLDYIGGNQAPSFASYQYLIQLYPTNPATAAPWLIADINTAEYGVKLTV